MGRHHSLVDETSPLLVQLVYRQLKVAVWLGRLTHKALHLPEKLKAVNGCWGEGTETIFSDLGVC